MAPCARVEHTRLAELKSTYDSDKLFGINHNTPPHPLIGETPACPLTST